MQLQKVYGTKTYLLCHEKQKYVYKQVSKTKDKLDNRFFSRSKKEYSFVWYNC